MSLSISVVIPFYNAEEFFYEALTSIRNQTHSVDEIIVVNDGCGSKATTFLSEFKDIKVITLKKNSGPSVARNTGVKAAQSKWIAFLDADDIWMPTKIESQIDFINTYPQFSVCHTGIETFNKDNIVATYNDKPFDLTVEDLLKSSHVTPPSLLIKKSVLKAVDFFDEKMHCSEDHDLSIRLIEQGYKIGFIPKALTKVRRMNHGNISSNGRKLIIGHYQLLKKNKHLFRKYDGLTSAFIYKTFMTAGGKSQGAERKLYYLMGHIIKFIFSIKD